MKRSTEEISKALEAFPKIDLEDIRNFFGAAVPSRVCKRDFVEQLGAFIVDRPAEWLGRMPERDLHLLSTLVEAGPGVPVEVDYPDYPSVLETVRLLSSDNSDPEIQRVWISRELYDVVAPHLADALEAGEKDGSFELDRAILGYLNLYGALPATHLRVVMQDYWEYTGRGRYRDFLRRFEEAPAAKMCRYIIDGEEYFAAPGISDPESLVLRQEENAEKIEDFPAFSVREALEAGGNAPFFTFRLATPQGEALLGLLHDLGYNDAESRRDAHDIWMSSQMVEEGDTTEGIFASVNRVQDEIESFDFYNEAMQIIADYANILPKWLLMGHCPDEVHMMKVVLRSDSGQLERIVKENPTMGLFVPAAPLYAPCPCGSGLSYKFCHGKYMN